MAGTVHCKTLISGLQVEDRSEEGVQMAIAVVQLKDANGFDHGDDAGDRKKVDGCKSSFGGKSTSLGM